MKEVASLRYGVIFKKAFGQVDIFKAFVKDTLGIELNIDKVETEKYFSKNIGSVDVHFDLYAEDKEQRIIVEIKHQNYPDHYGRFLHYHCVALLEQVMSAKNYTPPCAVYTIVIFTSSDKYQQDVLTIDFDPKTLAGKGVGEIPHKVIYLAPHYLNENTPELYKEWMQAVEDSLSEQVEESNFKHPEIQKVFDLIAKNLVSPQEKARMIDEYNWEELKKNEFDKGLKKGKLEMAIAMLNEGLDKQTIAKITGLTTEELLHLQTPNK
ncbi:MAG: Rpn family recombination-promoting nuclease/putative transposase [Methylococcaceae bacterium]|nr:Rpn family recombination-promoting nuclease/putative transposase [Methylococcaceae bacterium]